MLYDANACIYKLAFACYTDGITASQPVADGWACRSVGVWEYGSIGVWEYGSVWVVIQSRRDD